MMLLFSIYVFQIKRKKFLNNNYHSCVGSLISPLQSFFSLQKTSGYYAVIHLHNSLPHFFKIPFYSKDITYFVFRFLLLIFFLTLAELFDNLLFIIIMTSIPHIHITWLFVGHKHKNRLKS